MLKLNRVDAYYGKSQALSSVSLSVGPGELVALLGRNGAGKTTTLKTIAGLVQASSGEIECFGKNLVGRHTHEIARSGVALVPENRGIFVGLTVDENLKIASRANSRWSIDDVYGIFPRLKERRKNGGGMLSGGEQQMLSIARALVNAPSILLLDEPTEGLAPVIVAEIVSMLGAIRDSGIPILLVEQNLRVCERLANRFYIIEQGRIVHSASRQEFAGQQEIKDRFLGASTTH